MPRHYGIRDDLLQAVKTRLEASMTALSHSTNDVYLSTAPSQAQGKTRLVYQIDDDIEDQGFSDRNGTANDVVVMVAAWSPNASTALLLADDVIERMTLTSGAAPTLSVGSHTTFDVSRISSTSFVDQTAGLRDEFAEVMRFRVRLRLTSTIDP